MQKSGKNHRNGSAAHEKTAEYRSIYKLKNAQDQESFATSRPLSTTCAV